MQYLIGKNCFKRTNFIFELILFTKKNIDVSIQLNCLSPLVKFKEQIRCNVDSDLRLIKKI